MAVYGFFMVLTVKFIRSERSSPDCFSKISFSGGFSDLENRRDARAPFSGVFENQDAPVVQLDSRGFPRLSLVEPVWVRLMGIPGTVEPVEIRFVVGNPFFDRLLRRLDGFHGLDVEWRWRWARELDYAFLKARKAE